MIAIARLTIGETARKRILWVLIALALAAVALTAWGVTLLIAAARDAHATDLQIKLGVSQILIFIAFQFGFVLAMTAAFLGSPAIAADLESGVAQAMLARPIRRSDLVVGRWLGLAAVVVAYAVSSALLEIVAIGFVSLYYPPHPFLA